MKRIIIILSIVACATIAQAQHHNPLFAPFTDSMRIAAAMKMSERAQEAQPVVPAYPVERAMPDQLPETQYVYTEDGHLIMFIPTGPGTFTTFRAW